MSNGTGELRSNGTSGRNAGHGRDATPNPPRWPLCRRSALMQSPLSGVFANRCPHRPYTPLPALRTSSRTPSCAKLSLASRPFARPACASAPAEKWERSAHFGTPVLIVFKSLAVFRGHDWSHARRGNGGSRVHAVGDGGLMVSGGRPASALRSPHPRKTATMALRTGGDRSGRSWAIAQDARVQESRRQELRDSNLGLLEDVAS